MPDGTEGAPTNSVGNSILGGIIGAAPIVGNVANALIQSAQNKKAREWSEKMYGWQRNDALADWRMQNEYNSPAAQMERLRAAGLNPNLVYGHGADAQSQSMPRTASAPSWSPHAAQVDPNALSGGILAYQDYQVKQAQVSNMAVQQQLMKAEIDAKEANAIKILADAAKSRSSKDYIDTLVQLKGVDLSYATQVAATHLEGMKANVAKTYQDTKLSAANTAYRLNEDIRAQARLGISFREAASKIALNYANQLRAEAETQTSWYRKQVLTNQAIYLEKRIGTEDWNRELRKNEALLKGTEPSYYEKQYTEALQGMLRTLTGRGSYLNPLQMDRRLQYNEYGGNTRTWRP